MSNYELQITKLTLPRKMNRILGYHRRLLRMAFAERIAMLVQRVLLRDKRILLTLTSYEWKRRVTIMPWMEKSSDRA